MGGVGGLPGGVRQVDAFCIGVDWCLFGGEGWVASVGWDELVWVWDVGGIMGSR